MNTRGAADRILVECDDGNYLDAAHVYRWFMVEDVVAARWNIMASLPGPQHPYLVSHREAKSAAKHVLDSIVDCVGHVVHGGYPRGDGI